MLLRYVDDGRSRVAGWLCPETEDCDVKVTSGVEEKVNDGVSED